MQRRLSLVLVAFLLAFVHHTSFAADDAAQKLYGKLAKQNQERIRQITLFVLNTWNASFNQDVQQRLGGGGENKDGGNGDNNSGGDKSGSALSPAELNAIRDAAKEVTLQQVKLRFGGADGDVYNTLRFHVEEHDGEESGAKIKEVLSKVPGVYIVNPNPVTSLVSVGFKFTATLPEVLAKVQEFTASDECTFTSVSSSYSANDNAYNFILIPKPALAPKIEAAAVNSSGAEAPKEAGEAGAAKPEKKAEDAEQSKPAAIKEAHYNPQYGFLQLKYEGEELPVAEINRKLAALKLEAAPLEKLLGQLKAVGSNAGSHFPEEVEGTAVLIIQPTSDAVKPLLDSMEGVGSNLHAEYVPILRVVVMNSPLPVTPRQMVGLVQRSNPEFTIAADILQYNPETSRLTLGIHPNAERMKVIVQEAAEQLEATFEYDEKRHAILVKELEENKLGSEQIKQYLALMAKYGLAGMPFPGNDDNPPGILLYPDKAALDTIEASIRKQIPEPNLRIATPDPGNLAYLLKNGARCTITMELPRDTIGKLNAKMRSAATATAATTARNRKFNFFCECKGLSETDIVRTLEANNYYQVTYDEGGKTLSFAILDSAANFSFLLEDIQTRLQQRLSALGRSGRPMLFPLDTQMQLQVSGMPWNQVRPMLEEFPELEIGNVSNLEVKVLNVAPQTIINLLKRKPVEFNATLAEQRLRFRVNNGKPASEPLPPSDIRRLAQSLFTIPEVFDVDTAELLYFRTVAVSVRQGEDRVAPPIGDFYKAVRENAAPLSVGYLTPLDIRGKNELRRETLLEMSTDLARSDSSFFKEEQYLAPVVFPLYNDGQDITIRFAVGNEPPRNFRGTFRRYSPSRILVGKNFLNLSDLPKNLRARFDKKLNDEARSAFLQSHPAIAFKRDNLKDELEARVRMKLLLQMRSNLGRGWVFINEVWKNPSDMVDDIIEYRMKTVKKQFIPVVKGNNITY